ncbi:MAG TPA: DUF2173 family protein [bacterium]
MSSLKHLMKIDGVVAAGEFNNSGGWINYESKMEMSAELMSVTALFCATITMMHHTLSNAFSRASNMKWEPHKMWMSTSGDWVVMVFNNRGVFVEAAKADYNKIYQALSGKG